MRTQHKQKKKKSLHGQSRVNHSVPEIDRRSSQISGKVSLKIEEEQTNRFRTGPATFRSAAHGSKKKSGEKHAELSDDEVTAKKRLPTLRIDGHEKMSVDMKVDPARAKALAETSQKFLLECKRLRMAVTSRDP
ncbi:hypothetical protein B0O99DRAFT_668503 [Bisporella sp. PMI_857]|nr:hypothetical protein B0O99DRAFT_668503 [Bisporella sp. PMI_857]